MIKKAIHFGFLMFVTHSALAAEAKSLDIDIKQLNDLSQHDGSRWQVSVDTSYRTADGKVGTQHAFTLETDSGTCTSGKSRLLEMYGNSKVRVSDQLCVSVVDGNTSLNVWMTADYPKDIDTTDPHQGEAQFVYGTSTRLQLDKKASLAKSETSVYRLTFKRIRESK